MTLLPPSCRMVGASSRGSVVACGRGVVVETRSVIVSGIRVNTHAPGLSHHHPYSTLILSPATNHRRHRRHRRQHPAPTPLTRQFPPPTSPDRSMSWTNLSVAQIDRNLTVFGGQILPPPFLLPVGPLAFPNAKVNTDASIYGFIESLRHSDVADTASTLPFPLKICSRSSRSRSARRIPAWSLGRPLGT